MQSAFSNLMEKGLRRRWGTESISSSLTAIGNICSNFKMKLESNKEEDEREQECSRMVYGHRMLHEKTHHRLETKVNIIEYVYIKFPQKSFTAARLIKVTMEVSDLENNTPNADTILL